MAEVSNGLRARMPFQLPRAKSGEELASLCVERAQPGVPDLPAPRYLLDDELQPADASAVKVYGTESVIEVYHLLLGILGAVGYLRQGSPGAVLAGRVEQAGRSAQINTFGGGVNEIQREIVAWMGLGMTRGAR